MRRNLSMTLLVTAACVVVLTGCQRAASAARAETDLIPIQVRTPAVVERHDSVTASGSVEGSETTDVAFQVPGKVARVFVDEGQHVNRGQLLAELEPTDYRNALDAASAQKQVAEALAQKDRGNRKWKKLASTSIVGRTSTSACGFSSSERACLRTTFRK